MAGANLLGAAATIEMFDDVADQFGGADTWVVGTNVEYGLHLETGTSKMPAYPWLFPAAQDVADRKFDSLIAEASGLSAVLKLIALDIERQAKLNASAARGGNRSPGTDPNHPKRVSTNLVGSISADKA